MTDKLVLVMCWLLATAGAVAQQAPGSAHPAAKVELENEQVRVVRRYHAPHEKVPTHTHPDSVVVYLTEVRELSTDANGKTVQVTHHAGEVVWSPAHTHALENLADTPIEVIEIEFKPGAGKRLQSDHRGVPPRPVADQAYVRSRP